MFGNQLEMNTSLPAPCATHTPLTSESLIHSLEGLARLAAGPRNFVIIGEPEAAKHVLKAYGKYSKGLVAEVAEFLFGSGFAIAEGELWSVSVHQHPIKFHDHMLLRTSGTSP